ncbi:SSI family serine proteinase inhibitor [Streptomyces sp. SPB162]|uniref:SSI family serine proteinase inhibitor n=1 Tax=Streptomyces sp. SPB162 TaxID=2940560 RepID=UPI0024073C75|nr:SSI family serine proteinase inhibitor [Streptomyces sp. SPB162]MDF9814277.1 hypothetical protein [Streptomyces sp. SPB162]
MRLNDIARLDRPSSRPATPPPARPRPATRLPLAAVLGVVLAAGLPLLLASDAGAVPTPPPASGDPAPPANNQLTITVDDGTGRITTNKLDCGPDQDPAPAAGPATSGGPVTGPAASGPATSGGPVTASTLPAPLTATASTPSNPTASTPSTPSPSNPNPSTSTPSTSTPSPAPSTSLFPSGSPAGMGPAKAAKDSCDQLRRLSGPVGPVPTGQMCSMIYGGSQTAQVTGVWHGAPVKEKYSRSNGCEVARWNRMAPVLPAGPGRA